MHMYEGVRRVRLTECPVSHTGVMFEWIGDYDPSEHLESMSRGYFVFRSLLIDGTMANVAFKWHEIRTIEFDVDCPIGHRLLD